MRIQKDFDWTKTEVSEFCEEAAREKIQPFRKTGWQYSGDEEKSMAIQPKPTHILNRQDAKSAKSLQAKKLILS